VTSQQLEDFVFQSGCTSAWVFPRDGAYRLPDRKWLFAEFGAALESFKASLGSNQYTPESNDCDDFTDLAVWYARFLHARAKTADSIAFGSFIYTRDSGDCHSICCAIVNDPDPTLVFFEPQNSTEAFLTQQEIQSCAEARF
jgi:hypothetical protein